MAGPFPDNPYPESPYTPHLQMPGFMGGMLGPLGEMLLPGLVGAAGGGQFAPFFRTSPQNMFDQMKAERFFREQQALVGRLASVDGARARPFFDSIGRGMFGPNMTPDQQAFIGEMHASAVHGLSMAAPFMPTQMLDLMMGPRGSAMAMGRAMFGAGDGLLDPLSGKSGWSAQSTEKIVERITSSYDINAMRGIKMGAAGDLFGQLSMRGMVDADPGQGGDRVTKSADKIRTRLEKMAGAVDAMRDIFGDSGHSDAPMSELINGLEALTAGGFGGMSPEKVEQQVRMIRNLGKHQGGIDTIMNVTGMAGQLAQQRGLDRSMVSSMTLGSLAYGEAYRQLNLGEHMGWGGLSLKEAQATDTALRSRAANSISAQQMGFVTRMQDTFSFKAGSQAEALAAAIKEGKTTYEFGGQTHSVFNQSEADLSRILEAGGISAENVQAMRFDTEANLEAGAAYNVAGTARKLQANDLAPIVAAGALSGIGKDGGGNTAGMQAAITQAIFKLTPEERADQQKAIAKIAEAIMPFVGGDARKAKEIAARAYGDIQQGLKKYRYSIASLGTLHGADVVAKTDEEAAKAADKAAGQTEASKQGKTDPAGAAIEGIIKTIESLGDDKDKRSALAKMITGLLTGMGAITQEDAARIMDAGGSPGESGKSTGEITSESGQTDRANRSKMEITGSVVLNLQDNTLEFANATANVG